MLIVLACLALAVAGCGGDSDSSSSTSEAEGGAAKRDAAAAQNGTKPKVDVPSGPAPKKLVEKELIEGEGAEAKAGDEVTVQYVGVLYDNGEQFDASWDRGEPFSFTLGNSEVIAGWDQGVEGMKVGGRRELTIPPQLGYGSEEVGPIPANSTLVFVIDLLAVK
ncbi:MAG: FKBP-type peptidyl-prolyl cis-trans isomerase [Solirubrobacterales bacterium]